VDALWIGIGCFSLLFGLIGSFLPIIPGPPLSYFGLLCLFFHSEIRDKISLSWVIFFGITMLVITILDYILPIWGTKKFGGTQSGQRGSTIGLIVAILLGAGFPILGVFGVIVAPFFGAFAGELLGGQNSKIAWKSGFGSFLGFLTGTIMKLIFGLIMIFEFLKHCLKYWL
tara:strand:+ start:12871 stop:13383 length:513 start_codon:yes stop_codon:yes gene_type:complete